mgnify:FL=1
MWFDALIDKGILPDKALRFFVRSGLKKYTNQINRLSEEEIRSIQKDFVDTLLQYPITINIKDANEQHYEVPSKFFETILSAHMKYSGSIWDINQNTLQDSDTHTLDVYSKRSEIKDGDSILELGSGWGSLSIYLASKFPNSKITTVTNSQSQKDWIETKTNESNITNVEIIKSDVADFETSNKFDKILSIEMFEHLRNPKLLMDKIENWLSDEGLLFIQVFSHKYFPQFFDNTEKSWMSRYFFTGGMMPYLGLYQDLTSNLHLKSSWTTSGINYHNTLEAWLHNLLIKKSYIKSYFNKNISKSDLIDSNKYMNRYKLFLIFCSELFKYNNGTEWYVVNYLFSKRLPET